MSIVENLAAGLKPVEKKSAELPYFVVKEFPDAALRTPAQLYLDPVIGNAPFQELISVLEKTLEGYRAAGIAGPQVGLFVRIIAVRIGGKPLTMINPVITEASDATASAVEGCLSFPGLDMKVERAKNIGVVFTNRKGESEKRFLYGVEARAVQHEIDHLDGKTFLDRVPAFYRRGALQRMKLIQRRWANSNKKAKTQLADLMKKVAKAKKAKAATEPVSQKGAIAP